MNKITVVTISMIAACFLLLGIVSMFAPTHISFDARGAEILLDGSIIAEGSFTLEGYILHNPFQGDAFTLKDLHAPNLDARVIDVSHTLGPAYPIENHHLVPGIMEVRNQNDNDTAYNSFYIFSENYDFWINYCCRKNFRWHHRRESQLCRIYGHLGKHCEQFPCNAAIVEFQRTDANAPNFRGGVNRTVEICSLYNLI